MNLTNLTGLPQPIVDVARSVINSHPRMNSNEYSVTELLKGTKEIILNRRHHDELAIDVQQAFSLWDGAAIHKLLESVTSDNYLAEQRFTLDLGKWGKSLEGYTLSGSPDLYDKETATLYDYKTTKVASYDQHSTLEDESWLYQTLVYTQMLRNAGYKVEHIIIVAMMKDHSAVKAETTSGYPKYPIQIIDYSHLCWNGEFDAQMKGYYVNKVQEVLNMRDLSDDCVPPCTPSERFENEDWAIMKKGQKKAVRAGFTSESEASLVLETFDDQKNLSVVHRAGDPKKCRLYCSCAPFCNFYKQHMTERLSKQTEQTEKTEQQTE